MTGRARTPVIHAALPLPRLVEASGALVQELFVEFFAARVRNANTRAAYLNAVMSFFAFLERNGTKTIAEVKPLDVACWLEALAAEGRPVATRNLRLAAVRMLFIHLALGGAVPMNPTLPVRGVRQSMPRARRPSWRLARRDFSCARFPRATSPACATAR